MLEDSADNPRFIIETLPRLPLYLPGAVESPEITTGEAAKDPHPQQPKLRRILVPAALLLVTTAIGGNAALPHAPEPPPTDRDTTVSVLSDFDNKTGDRVFDDTLKQGLSVQLEQSPFLELISERRVNDTLS